ncbi:MAG: hypothetical protein QF483_09720 [Gammaproteobacteria bacterium]|nr:hypothetical protein [Gammaproteobacteria bacterium]MDP7296088.1 hypothetical protein [Gammaproteobacteria bacterium]MDP7420150.1 hypothetical protein [Gammaproteobacteria bacterium]
MITRIPMLCAAILLTGVLCGFVVQADELPQNNYMIHCQGCHLPDGAGKPPDVPSFTGQLAEFLRVEGGRAYLVQVPGTANALLDDQAVAKLLNWMVERFNQRTLPADFIPYTASEVTHYRSQVLADPGARRATLLERLSLLH